MRPWVLYWIAVAMVLFIAWGSIEWFVLTAVASVVIAVVAWMLLNRRRNATPDA